MPKDSGHTWRGNEFVDLVAEELFISKGAAGQVIGVVFHALRGVLSHEESFQLVAQLPVGLKGTYVEGWRFDKDFAPVRHTDDFLQELRNQETTKHTEYAFGSDEKAKNAVAAVFRAMHFFVHEEEFCDVLNVLPEEMKEFIHENITGDHAVF